MSDTEIKRDHEGALHLYVNGAPVRAVSITSVFQDNVGKLSAVATIPLDKVSLGEVDTVIPAAHRFGVGA